MHSFFSLSLRHLLAVVTVAGCACSSTPEQAQRRLADALASTIKGKPERQASSLRVRSASRGLDVALETDAQAPEAFHAASVGKLFTAALVARRIDDGRLSFDAKVAPLLPPGELDGLFVVDGVDHQGEVTVAQLLAHTSGMADYFGDVPAQGPRLSERIAHEPERRWEARSLLDYTREQLPAVAAPGAKFHYSDGGYVVLGRVVEAVSGKPFEVLLHQELFGPLGMTRTWMPFRTAPAQGAEEQGPESPGPGPLRPAYLHGVDVSGHPAITADWAGGGVASTTGDLLRFQEALWSGALVRPETLEAMQRFEHRFETGLHYGLGLMQYRFGEYFFALGGYPKMVGHMGVLGTQLFYDAKEDLHVSLSLGSDGATEDSVRLLIDVVGIALQVPKTNGKN